MSLLNRIKALAHKQGLTLRDIEIQLNLGTRSMQKWDKNSPSANKVLDVANLLHTSVDYLLTGNVLNKDNLETSMNNGISNKYELLSDIDQMKVNSFIEIATFNLESKYEDTKTALTTNKLNETETAYTYEKSVPILGKVTAGIPIPLIEDYIDQAAAPSDKVNFTTIAKGDSMEPVIHNGENIFIRFQQNLDNGT